MLPPESIERCVAMPTASSVPPPDTNAGWANNDRSLQAVVELAPGSREYATGVGVYVYAGFPFHLLELRLHLRRLYLVLVPSDASVSRVAP